MNIGLFCSVDVLSKLESSICSLCQSVMRFVQNDNHIRKWYSDNKDILMPYYKCRLFQINWLAALV